MLTSLHIEKFRGINELDLANTGRVNLIVGRNDSGKTSLLEAIRFGLTGHPRFLRRPDRIRTLPTPDKNRQHEFFLHQILHAFYQFQVTTPILISCKLGELKITTQAAVEPNSQPFFVVEDFNEEDTDSLLKPNDEIVINVSANDKATMRLQQNVSLRASEFNKPRREFKGEPFPELPTPTWLGTNRMEHWNFAERYSSLFRSGGEEVLMALLKQIEPNLRRLIVLTNGSLDPIDYAVLEADIGLAKTLPINDMGDGFCSLISLLSAIGEAKGGICLIDEVENGIHYAIHRQLWRSVAEAATNFDAQIWATTHSYDCITSICDAFEHRPNDLRVHRLQRNENGIIGVHTFTHDLLKTALERGLEVR